MSKALEMAEKVVNFLCDCGNLPPVLKDKDSKIAQAENKLTNKLLALQAGIEAEFIKALNARGYLPANASERRELVSKIFEVPFRDMSDVIADESVEGAKIGRQLTIVIC